MNLPPFPRTLDSYSHREMLVQTLSHGRIPYFPYEMLPRNAAALRVCVSSPKSQSLMYVLTSVLPTPPDVSPVCKIPYLSILNPCLVSSSGKVSGHCKNPKNIPYPQLLKKHFSKLCTKAFLMAEVESHEGESERQPGGVIASQKSIFPL